MNKQLKVEWVEALLSGERKQGQGKLRRENCFCCLGVLADIIPGVEWKEPIQHFDDSMTCIFEERFDSTLLPDRLLEYTGLSYESELALAHMNDSGATFADIARKIELDSEI